MNDKALVQIPSIIPGVVQKLYYKQGEIAKVHSPLFSMTADDVAPANDVVESIAEIEVTQKIVDAVPATTEAPVVASEGLVKADLSGKGKALSEPCS